MSKTNRVIQVLIVLALLLVVINQLVTQRPPILWERATACGLHRVGGKTVVEDFWGRQQYYLFLSDWPTQVSKVVYDTYEVGGTAAACDHAGDNPWYVILP